MTGVHRIPFSSLVSQSDAIPPETHDEWLRALFHYDNLHVSLAMHDRNTDIQFMPPH